MTLAASKSDANSVRTLGKHRSWDAACWLDLATPDRCQATRGWIQRAATLLGDAATLEASSRTDLPPCECHINHTQCFWNSNNFSSFKKMVLFFNYLKSINSYDNSNKKLLVENKLYKNNIFLRWQYIRVINVNKIIVH